MNNSIKKVFENVSYTKESCSNFFVNEIERDITNLLKKKSLQGCLLSNYLKYKIVRVVSKVVEFIGLERSKA